MRALAVLALALAAAPALAQQPAARPARPAAAPAPDTSTCDVQIDTSRYSQFTQVGNAYDTYGWGGVWAHCRGQPTTMFADSVAWYPALNQLRMVGDVRFRDSVSILDADSVTYFLRQERLFARGHVYTKNLKTGSDLRGDNLDYYRAAPPLRDTVELVARDRPTIHFYASHPATPQDTQPFLVVSDRARMKGNDRFWGGGNVTINRSDLAASGDSGQINLTRNAAALLGSPQLNGVGPDAYHLRGDRIDFALTPEHEIHGVLSSGHAAARGSDWSLDADTIALTLDSGKVQLAEAWGGKGEAEGRARRPRAVSGRHTIVADSLDIHMPGQQVRLVWAFGRARTTTRDSGSTAEDWLAGDSLRADFAARRDSATGKSRSELEHLTSFGTAQALYHVEPSDTAGTGGRKAVDYSRGRRIDIALANSKVQTVDVVGQVDGVYLEPVPPPADTSHADSTRADTTRGAADTTRAAADTAHAPPAATTRRSTPGRGSATPPAPPATPRPAKPASLPPARP